MIRGGGKFIVGDGATDVLVNATARLSIVEFAEVEADNFELTLGGELLGLGSFQAHRFDWTGGFMGTDGAGGVTKIGAGDLMVVNGGTFNADADRYRTAPFLGDRDIRILADGELQWGADAESVSDIALGTGSIIVDGGTFTILNNQKLVAAVAPTPPGMILVKSGKLIKPISEFINEPSTIEVALELHGGEVVFEGRIDIVGEFAGFKQIGGTMRIALSPLKVQKLEMTAGEFLADADLESAGNFEIKGGRLTLTDSTITAAAITINTAGTLAGRGTVAGSVQLEQGGTVEVNGTLNVTQTFDQDGGMLKFDVSSTQLFDRLIANTVNLRQGAQIVVNFLFQPQQTDKIEGIVQWTQAINTTAAVTATNLQGLQLDPMFLEEQKRLDLLFKAN